MVGKIKKYMDFFIKGEDPFDIMMNNIDIMNQYKSRFIKDISIYFQYDCNNYSNNKNSIFEEERNLYSFVNTNYTDEDNFIQALKRKEFNFREVKIFTDYESMEYRNSGHKKSIGMVDVIKHMLD